MDKNADLVLDNNKNELIRNAVWVGVATIASKILVFLFLYILFGCWENLIHGKKLNRRLTLFIFYFLFIIFWTEFTWETFAQQTKIGKRASFLFIFYLMV